MNTQTDTVSDNQENELFAYRIVPYETAESSVLASTHGLSAPLPADVPMPEFLVEGSVRSYALQGAFGTVINLRATFEEWATLNWFLDADDPVTWTLLDAWQNQGGLQVGANRNGEAYPCLAFVDQSGILNDDIEAFRVHSGEGATPYFFLQATVNCRAAASEAAFTRGYPRPPLLVGPLDVRRHESLRARHDSECARWVQRWAAKEQGSKETVRQFDSPNDRRCAR
jgi:hypothetical protein